MIYIYEGINDNEASPSPFGAIYYQVVPVSHRKWSQSLSKEGFRLSLYLEDNLEESESVTVTMRPSIAFHESHYDLQNSVSAPKQEWNILIYGKSESRITFWDSPKISIKTLVAIKRPPL